MSAQQPSGAWAGVLASMEPQHTEPEQRTEYLWPCNVPTWSAWKSVQTQWRIGANGATGLDYAGVRAELDEAHVAPEQRQDIWLGIKACEAAVLDVWAEKQQQQQDNPG